MPQTLDSKGDHELLLKLQGFLQPGTVIVIGSGLSVSYGLPSMDQLAQALLEEVPGLLNENEQSMWEPIKLKLQQGQGLESALRGNDLSSHLYSAIVKATACAVREPEQRALLKLDYSTEVPPLAKLIKYLAVGPRKIPVITTNYDRLIEAHCELSGLGVDVGFPGPYLSAYNPTASARGHQKIEKDNRKIRKIQEPHVRLFKPHGSLDWMRTSTSVRRCLTHSIEFPAIIPPGPSKYQTGYQEPFSLEREAANKAIGAAERFIAIGYGFNDDQLEQSWCPELGCEKPILILTKALTDNAKILVQKSPLAIAVTEASLGSHQTLIQQFGAEDAIVDRDLWSLKGFVKGTTTNEK